MDRIGASDWGGMAAMGPTGQDDRGLGEGKMGGTRAISINNKQREKSYGQKLLCNSGYGKRKERGQQRLA